MFIGIMMQGAFSWVGNEKKNHFIKLQKMKFATIKIKMCFCKKKKPRTKTKTKTKIQKPKNISVSNLNTDEVHTKTVFMEIVSGKQ